MSSGGKGGGAKGGGGKKKEVKKETKLGMAYKKDDNFGEWYSEVVVNSEMIEYYDISGCYILRPWAMEIWELLKEFFDAEIKKLKLKPYYFPLFVTENVLQKEKDHIEGFAPEVAWVTKSGKSDLEAPIAIRPTTLWVKHSATILFRSREFLWQEGHTAFATKEEADEEVLQILELYRRIYEEFLAVPVSKGRKSEMEKFAGGLYTTSVEAFIPNTGRGIQGATSHCLGQNFAKMFDITYENEKGAREMIGVMVMTHGDDKGLVLPPRVAPIQVIVIPVPYKDADTTAIKGACESAVYTLNESGFRADLDTRENYSPGWKYSHWEMKGVPLRIEIGPKDLANKQVRIVRRDNGAKVDIPVANLVEEVKALLDEIQGNLLKTAKEKRDACIEVIHTWDEFTAALNNKRLILAPWCDEEEVEKDVKNRTKGDLGAAKTLCTPFDQPELPEGSVCFASGKPAKKWSFWGRSY
ncbi:Proline--tRNA ligase, cytoplasmic [Dichanthelium oligosanthes]|uniref:proline--tRNA ligase n=1 Tax=Dichanthelium oligosanthes TaxID=888268 RepID=A0A1E5VQS1_9POAL|nr:Proline--tRNA ligase, cytoplasmic [Dichanthelium oligosanthes]